MRYFDVRDNLRRYEGAIQELEKLAETTPTSVVSVHQTTSDPQITFSVTPDTMWGLMHGHYQRVVQQARELQGILGITDPLPTAPSWARP